jgi:hypothetical protein
MMERTRIGRVEFLRLKKSYQLSASESEDCRGTGDAHSQHSHEHRMVVLDLVHMAEFHGWQTSDELGFSIRNDVYINFDFFSSRIVYMDIICELRDLAEKTILSQIQKLPSLNYMIIANIIENDEPVHLDVIACGKIYTVDPKSYSSSDGRNF